MSWPTQNNTASDSKTFTQAQNTALAAKDKERDAKFATKTQVDELKKQIEELKELVKSERVHRSSDLDSSGTAQHHTLGLGSNNASSGSHNHDGANSRRITMNGVSMAGADFSDADIEPEALLEVGSGTGPMRLLDGSTISGSRTSDTWRVSVTNAIERLGATDSSSA